LKKALNILYLIILVGTVIFISQGSKERRGRIKCKALHVEVDDQGDLYFVNREMVKKLILEKLESLIGKPYKDINIYMLEEFVDNHPNIKKAELYLGNEGVMFVKVQQFKPSFRIFEADTSYYLDKQFEMFPLSDNYSARVAQVYWSKISDCRLEILRKIDTIMQKDEFLKSLVTGIAFDVNNELTLYTRLGNHVILLGKASRLVEKIKKLKAFYALGIKKIGWDRYSKINLKFDDQVICTKR
jgi:cell division protein FtsQ